MLFYNLKLYTDTCYVFNPIHMPHSNSTWSFIFCDSFGTHLLDHLAADGAGFPGGQVAVIAIGQVDAHFPWCPFYILNSPDKEVPAGF